MGKDVVSCDCEMEDSIRGLPQAFANTVVALTRLV